MLIANNNVVSEIPVSTSVAAAAVGTLPLNLNLTAAAAATVPGVWTMESPTSDPDRASNDGVRLY